jgi:pilus assembly protein CpaE
VNPTLKALVALDKDVNRQLVESLVSGGPELSVLDYVDLAAKQPSDDGSGDVLVVACSEYGPMVGEYLVNARQLRPARPVVLLCSAATNGYVADAFAAGADDIVTLPQNNDPAIVLPLSRQVVFTVEKAVARKRGLPQTPQEHQGRLICVLGLKGGSGKTLTSANLAVALAEAGQRVVIVDIDLQFGDVGLALGLRPERTIYDVVRSGGSLDAQKLEAFLLEHPSGARALLAPVRPDQAGAVTPDFLREVYGLLRQTYDYVVIDTPPSFSPEVIASVDCSTEVCVVAMLDSLSLKNTKIGLETLERMDYDSSRIRVVLNRADSNVGIGTADAMAIIGRQPDILVPSDRSVVRSINEGQPIAMKHKRSEAGRAFHALAALYADDLKPARGEPTKTHKPRRRLFRRAR